MTYGYLIDRNSQDAGDLRALTAPPPYLGQVATRCFIPENTNLTSKQNNSRTVHIARDNITSLQFLFPNWHCKTGGGEQGLGASATLFASIEYPLGTTPQRIYFGGAQSVVIPDLTTAISDILNIVIPRGAPFAVKTFYANPNGILYAFGRNASTDGFLEGTANAASGLTDQTLTTTNPTASVAGYGPCAIIGMTSRSSIFLSGDSRVLGVSESNVSQDPTGAKGEFERSIAKEFAFINASAGGDRIAVAVAGYTLRLALAQYCTHVLINYGINDLNNGRSTAQIMADLVTLAGMFGSKPVRCSTVAPYTTSTDGWTTTANQTVSGIEANRVALNKSIRRVPAPFAGIVEIADAVESGRDSGLWKANFTPDGLHENSAATLAIEQERAIDPRWFLRQLV